MHVNVDLYHTTNRTATTNGPISLVQAAGLGKYGYGNGYAVMERISGTVLISSYGWHLIIKKPSSKKLWSLIISTYDTPNIIKVINTVIMSIYDTYPQHHQRGWQLTIKDPPPKTVIMSTYDTPNIIKGVDTWQLKTFTLKIVKQNLPGRKWRNSFAKMIFEGVVRKLQGLLRTIGP